jgi:hypothetical protein
MLAVCEQARLSSFAQRTNELSLSERLRKDRLCDCAKNPVGTSWTIPMTTTRSKLTEPYSALTSVALIGIVCCSTPSARLPAGPRVHVVGDRVDAGSSDWAPAPEPYSDAETPQGPAAGDGRARSSKKGEWGRVSPIADGKHPKLYYDQSEIDELRQMILVQHRPERLFKRYNAEIRDAVAVKPTRENSNPHVTNMKAALSYAIKPTAEKADAIRACLLSFTSAFPGGLPGWYDTPGCYFSGYSLPWMFDLISAYHSDKFDSAEKTKLKNWFRKSAENLKFDTRNPGAPSQSGRDVVPAETREGKTMVSFPNWFSRYMGPALACALVSDNQAVVDYWADSGWPHDLFTFEGVNYPGGTYPSSEANRYDLVMYLLAVYPSGANTDTYHREGFRLPERTWSTTSYTSGGYHFGQMSGAVLGAEMAFHNGMTGVFGITDQGTEPALLRHWKRAIQSRTETDSSRGNAFGHPVIGFSQQIWAGYRRYRDPTIEGAVATLQDSMTDELEIPAVVWEFFGHPRRLVWPPP